jgi:hypothetical protein
METIAIDPRALSWCISANVLHAIFMKTESVRLTCTAWNLLCIGLGRNLFSRKKSEEIGHANRPDRDAFVACRSTNALQHGGVH